MKKYVAYFVNDEFSLVESNAEWAAPLPDLLLKRLEAAQENLRAVQAAIIEITAESDMAYRRERAAMTPKERRDADFIKKLAEVGLEPKFNERNHV